MDRNTNAHDMRRRRFDESCFGDSLVYSRHVRSLLYNEDSESTEAIVKKKSIQLLSAIRRFRLIRVLGKVCITENSQLRILYTLTNLRYLHIYLSNRSILFSPALRVGESISKLQNLETLIFSGVWSTGIRPSYRVFLPLGIWEMPRLRHMVLPGLSKLRRPAVRQISCSSLQTLSWVTNFSLTTGMAEKLSNIKKLKLQYTDIYSSADESCFLLKHLMHLQKLLELTIAREDDARKLTDYAFPDKIRKLSLKGTEIPLSKMSLIGSLPNLEVLKLKKDAVIGQIRERNYGWEPVEGMFLQLKYLKMKDLIYLDEWRAESIHFPLLETLVIEECWLLKEVPLEIGEINTLCRLVLKNCKAAEESVEEIKAEQESMCNDLLQVIIIS